jgi:hypothetical protein
MPAIWQNPDGTLRDFSRCPYWIEEEYRQWARGSHQSHVDNYHTLIAAEKFRHYHAERAFQRSQIQEAAQEMESLLSMLPEPLRTPVINKPINPNANPRAFRLGLRRDVQL